MLREAFRSACATTPQPRQMKSAWLARFRFAMWWQSAHSFEVHLGSTCTTGTPERCALYAINDPSCANAQELIMTRWGLRSRTRARMPVRSSRAMPRPVRSASVTMRLAMQ